MAKIIFAGSREDLHLVDDSLMEVLRDEGHEIGTITTAVRLAEAMVSGEGELFVLIGGLIPLGAKWRGRHTFYAGFAAVELAREQGTEVPVLLLETFQPPRWAWDLEKVVYLSIPCTLDDFLAAVTQILEDAQTDDRGPA